jgi:hypothetical protein
VRPLSILLTWLSAPAPFQNSYERKCLGLSKYICEGHRGLDILPNQSRREKTYRENIEDTGDQEEEAGDQREGFEEVGHHLGGEQELQHAEADDCGFSQSVKQRKRKYLYYWRLCSLSRHGIHFLKNEAGNPVSERKRMMISTIFRAIMRKALKVPAAWLGTLEALQITSELGGAKLATWRTR